jgi:hypothetical protein
MNSQAHPALESLPDSRLICGLENADLFSRVSLAQLRHESAHRAAKSFRISSGYRRVCTTLAIEFEVLGEVESQLAEELLLFG